MVADAVEAGLSTSRMVTGEDFYRDAPGSKLWAIGYVTGVTDTGVLGPAGQRYCMPPGVTVGQMLDVAMKYLAENPANRHLGAAHLIRQSYRDAWPCAPADPPPKAKPKASL